MFLVAVSRLLDAPLSALLLAPPGSGKSHLIDTVLRLVPPEAVIATTALSAKSLFYSRDLAHKLLVVEELEGTAGVEHPLRVLQSAGRLSQTRTVRGEAHTIEVRGPVAVLSGTTDPTIDLQNASRCLVLTPDTSPAQTQRIQAARAAAWAGAAPTPPDLVAWHDAQRLLERHPVAIPFAPELRFPAATTTHRRGHGQLLGLVASHALLHQRQRERDAQGRLLAVPDDYRAVHALLAPLVEGALEELSPRAAACYARLRAADTDLTRRQVASAMGWGYSTARRALDELIAVELVRVVASGPPARHRVLDRSLTAGSLTDPDALTDPTR